MMKGTKDMESWSGTRAAGVDVEFVSVSSPGFVLSLTVTGVEADSSNGESEEGESV